MELAVNSLQSCNKIFYTTQISSDKQRAYKGNVLPNMILSYCDIHKNFVHEK